MEIIYKAIVYLIVMPIVFYSIDSLNVNMIFKKNSNLKARLLYLFVGIGLSYLVASFILSFF